MGTNKPDAGQGMVTTIQSIACGGTGGEMTAVDAKDGKIVRIRPMRIDANYTVEELAGSLWSLEALQEPRGLSLKARRLGARRRSREDQRR